jgi:hypothetical protein
VTPEYRRRINNDTRFSSPNPQTAGGSGVTTTLVIYGSGSSLGWGFDGGKPNQTSLTIGNQYAGVDLPFDPSQVGSSQPGGMKKAARKTNPRLSARIKLHPFYLIMPFLSFRKYLHAVCRVLIATISYGPTRPSPFSSTALASTTRAPTTACRAAPRPCGSLSTLVRVECGIPVMQCISKP